MTRVLAEVSAVDLAGGMLLTVLAYHLWYLVKAIDGHLRWRRAMALRDGRVHRYTR